VIAKWAFHEEASLLYTIVVIYASEQAVTGNVDTCGEPVSLVISTTIVSKGQVEQTIAFRGLLP
jgi:hypothetical protein